MAALDAAVAVVGGGVVGVAVAHALAGVGAPALVLEAEDGLALGASGTNSGILHTGFDSHPGELETAMILRAAELRERVLPGLGVPVLRCGAVLRPRDEGERRAVAVLAENARRNGVEAHLDETGSLRVPGEAVTDPVALVLALADAARAGGAGFELGARVVAIEDRGPDTVAVALADGRRVHVRAVVNCAGLFADEVARMAGDELLDVYPRKGEFLVFEPPPGEALSEILLPVPSDLGKGVLVFPTVDGQLVAGPTARERTDKRDWSVEPDAEEIVLERARAVYPPLEGCRPVGAYAGLRPAGDGVNYVIERSRARASVVHVAAIRSTGLSAALAIGEHVAAMLSLGGALAPRPRSAPRPVAHAPGEYGPETRPWWRRAALYRESRA